MRKLQKTSLHTLQNKIFRQEAFKPAPNYTDLCEAGGCLDAKGLGGCLGPKHPPAGGCLAERTAKADFYAAASAASAAASAVCTSPCIYIGARRTPL